MFTKMLYGLIIGIGLILPGVSGGVIAVILNIYDDIVYSLNNFFKKPKQNIRFIFPIIVGALVGVFLLGNLIKFLLFEENFVQPYFFFIGLILGSIPKLISKTKEKGKPNNIFILFSFVVSLLIFILGKDLVDLSIVNVSETQSLVYLFITGIIFSLGKIVPGISSSFMLMLIGTYEYFINLITDPVKMISQNYIQFIVLLLGVIFGVFIFIKLMNLLLNKHYCKTYSIIIGFVTGSVFAIYPGITFDIQGVISLLILVLSFIFSYKFSLLSIKK